MGPDSGKSQCIGVTTASPEHLHLCRTQVVKTVPHKSQTFPPVSHSQGNWAASTPHVLLPTLPSNLHWSRPLEALSQEVSAEAAFCSCRRRLSDRALQSLALGGMGFSQDGRTEAATLLCCAPTEYYRVESGLNPSNCTIHASKAAALLDCKMDIDM